MMPDITLTEAPGVSLYCGDALAVLATLPDSSIDLIATDPPYFRVKGLAWDRAWNTADGFLAWIGQLADEWRRVLKPNGSLYCFASPKMAARVEVEIGKRMEVLTRITWRKPPYSTKAEMFRKEDLRAYFPASEAIIFAEQFGADAGIKPPDGKMIAQEPVRRWLDEELRRSGLSIAQVRDAIGFSSNVPFHWFARGYASGKSSQWQLPSRDHYRDLQRVTGYFRRDYDDLVRESESLQRHFAISADVPYADVWDFKTVPHRPGKHVCEKPLDLCEHIILASSRPGAVVLDSFCGSGAFGHAAVKHGRTFIGSDNDPHWIAKSAQRIEAASRPPPQASLFPDQSVPG